jgi:glycosyltransferase involved in cell wall biosynthesis
MNLYGRRMLQDAARVLFATTAERDKALYSENVRPAVIRWPVPHVPDHSKDSFAAEICRTLALPPKQKIALFCGRLHPMKRPLETIQAFLNVAPPHWTLLVVGPPSAEIPLERIQKMAVDSGQRIRVIGPVYGKPLWDFYRAANLLLLFSRRENFGLVVAEALASGTPVAVTDSVDLSRSITDRQCGFVLRKYSDDDLNHALHSILRIDPGDMAEMGLRGREWVRRDLSMESFRRNLIELSQSVSSFQPEARTQCTS